MGNYIALHIRNISIHYVRVYQPLNGNYKAHRIILFQNLNDFTSMYNNYINKTKISILMLSIYYNISHNNEVTT